ncbi:MAG: formylglycine-generating enzyme family protein [Fimbriiglobus sp.]
MLRRSLTVVLFCCTLSVLVSFAFQDDPKPIIPDVKDIPSKVNLSPKNFTQKIPGQDDISFEMVYVPGGEFLMGSPDSEAGRKDDEGPQRKVKVNPYFLAKFETTWEQFYAFWKDQGVYVIDAVPDELTNKLTPDAITRPTNTYVDELYEHGRDGHPAMCMSHHTAMMFCRWMQWKTKLGFRLPTEAEWEFAARAGSQGPYHFDDKAEKLSDYAWYVENSNTSKETDGTSKKGDAEEPTTHIVGKKKANKLGLHDMHGNVWEWCLDRYDPKSFSLLNADKVNLGAFLMPQPNVKWGHTVRGGSYADKPDRLRSAARRVSEPIWIKDDPQGLSSIWWLTKMDVIGFRICLPLEEYPELVGLKPSLLKKPEDSEVGVRKRVKKQ